MKAVYANNSLMASNRYT